MCSSGDAFIQMVKKDESNSSKLAGSETMPPPVARIMES